MNEDTKKNLLRALGFFFISVFTGLAVYQNPPESMSQLGMWLWQPFIQGILASLTSLGLNSVTENGKKK